MIRAGFEHRLERTPGLPEDTHVEPSERRGGRSHRRERRAGLMQRCRRRSTNDTPALWNLQGGVECLSQSTAGSEGRHTGDGESPRGPTENGGGLESQPVAKFDLPIDLDDQMAAIASDDYAEQLTAVVRLRPGDVVTPGATAIHAAGESPAVDLDQRLHLFFRRGRPLRIAEPVQPLAVRPRDRRDVFGLLLSPFDLEATDPGLGDRGEVIERPQVARGNQIPAIELGTGRFVAEDVVLAARLRAGSAVRASLGDHPRHEALP